LPTLYLLLTLFCTKLDDILALSPLLGPLFVGSQCGNRIGLEFDFPSVLSIRVLSTCPYVAWWPSLGALNGFP